PDNDIPIRHVTNGIHTLSWVSEGLAELYDRYISPRWRTETHDNTVWNKVHSIPNEELWRVHNRYRERLVLFTRDYLLKKQKSMLSASGRSQVNSYLNPDALTIGFARRFATYKRATLLFSDMPRLHKILCNEERPVQLIIAGKAHPHDTAGKEMIQKIIHDVRAYGLDKHVVFLEDYSIAVARRLVKGCDVWLNTPRRPHEASGTSGMKAALNGCLHASILDGWWAESYNGENGFAIGTGEEYGEAKDMDIIEAATLYELLEQIIVPEFYERNYTKVPVKWVQRMKNSIATCAGLFSTHRMLRDYTTKFYIPSMNRAIELRSDVAKKGKELRDWKHKVRSSWADIEIIDVQVYGLDTANVGGSMYVKAVLRLGSMDVSDIVVEAYHGSVNADGFIIDGRSVALDYTNSESGYAEFRGSYTCLDGGKQGCTVRVIPTHKYMYDNADMRLCTWA
ncbi:MAG TPA: alpha-glucan family phosphorylase, partial [Candidatus Kapabacteria bacterium]|nr:alpha-glucan family phosphorylase [Candidatus Kapabacteria bacterium]